MRDNVAHANFSVFTILAHARLYSYSNATAIICTLLSLLIKYPACMYCITMPGLSYPGSTWIPLTEYFQLQPSIFLDIFPNIIGHRSLIFRFVSFNSIFKGVDEGSYIFSTVSKRSNSTDWHTNMSNATWNGNVATDDLRIDDSTVQSENTAVDISVSGFPLFHRLPYHFVNLFVEIIQSLFHESLNFSLCVFRNIPELTCPHFTWRYIIWFA